MSKNISKSIKILIASIIAMFFISTISFGWSPSNRTPIYPQNGYFCKEKGGAVRFTQISNDYYLLRFRSSDHNQYECRCEECYWNHSSDYLWSGGLDDLEAFGNDDLRNIYASLAEYTRPIPSNSVQLKWYNNGFPVSNSNSTDVPYGPKVAQTPVLNVTATPTRTNDTVGYIFSSSSAVSPTAQGHSKGNYTGSESDKADDTTKQYALWADSTYNEGNLLGANALYNEAKEFQSFYSANIAGGYNASIDSSNAQVIANRSSKTYIIGPYRAFYPDNSKFSYVEDLYVRANGKTVQPKNILFKSKSSGKPYPSSGEEFFVEFSASDTGNPTSAEIGIKLCYISKASATYQELRGKGEIRQFIQHRKNYTKTVTGTHYYDSYEIVGYEPVEYDPITEEPIGGGDAIWDWVERSRSHTHTHYGADIYITLDLIGYYNAQAAAHYLSSERIWTNKTVTSSIDLTMKLGGIVWEDANGVKESIYNGTIDITEAYKERMIPNVPVTLYKEDGKQIATTKTDSNGEYRFKGLNAMYKYYVKFTYNGQYYQPTTFADGNTWGTNSWTTNSNAKDVRNERLSYNAKFESIGSAPANYEITKNSKVYNETFSKTELLGYTLGADGTYNKTREAVIDDFGNLILQSSNDATTKKMIQYVKDCMIDAYTTADGAVGTYPTPNIFVIDKIQYPSMLTPNATPLYPNAYYINLGLNPREESDIAIKKDVEKVTLEINGQKHIYTYDTLENKENAENTWDINLRLSDVVSNKKYYDTNYTRELYTSDYLYKVSDYGTNFADYGKVKSDELEVYITYKIMVRNQAMSIEARIDEVVDYYDEDLDEDLEYVDTRSYIEIKRGTNAGKYATQASETSRYESIAKDTRTEIEGYDNLYIRGLSEGAQLIDDSGNNSGNPISDGIYLEGGQTAYVYLTFKVKKDSKDGEDWVILDEKLEDATQISVGKENIVELNGYSTRYAKGTKVPNVGDVGYNPAGIVDRDSKPGNLKAADVPKDAGIEGTENADKKVNYHNFEDDTDKAPNIRIILNRKDEAVRVISGTVWEDERTESIGVTTTGDGIRDDKDKTLINGVTVQLVELMENGTEHIWRTFEKGSGTATETAPIINKYGLVQNYQFNSDNHDGQYAFKSFMPGKYIVRFIYGDTEKTVLPKDLKIEGFEEGMNVKSYNGQDYKSTTYQEGINQYEVDQNGNVTDKNTTYKWKENSTWVNGQEKEGKDLTEISTFKADASNNETANATVDAQNQKGYLYDITESDKYSNVSDAKDIMTETDYTVAENIKQYVRPNEILNSREDVIKYSNNGITNYIAEVLASHKEEYQNKTYKTENDKSELLKELMANTKMTAETGLMVIEFEYDTSGTDGNKKDNTYKIQNVDLGLEERPKAQLAIDKEVTNVKLTLADGSILFDAKNTASNVLWRDHKEYYETNAEGKIDVYDKNMIGAKLQSISKIREYNSNKFGLIQLTMDEELMHGATMEITYQVTIRNIGEVDYYNTYKVGDTDVSMSDRKFYYTGNKSEDAKVVTTRADQVIDYVANNLQFNVSKNNNWKVIEKNILNNSNNKQSLVNNSLKTQVEKYNTVIETQSLRDDLVPNLYKDGVDENAQDSVSVPLVLTQLITSENDSDDLTYRNLVEIVKTSNTVGRRMEYSVVGNQDPQQEPQELDSDIAEVVKILPPFGNAGIYITIALVTIASLAIIIGGTIFIKKKVLRK